MQQNNNIDQKRPEENNAVIGWIVQFSHFIFPAFYAVCMRVLAEIDMLDIDTVTFTVVVPIARGFIPFFFHNSGYRKYLWKAILYPFVSILLFAFIVAGVGLEDLLCLVIVGLPYIGMMIVVSSAIHFILKKKDSDISQNYLPLIFIPFLLGPLEKKLPKTTESMVVSNEIILEISEEELIKNLYQVPVLQAQHVNSLLKWAEVPLPLYSTYDSLANARIGHFSNGMTLYEECTRTKNRLTFQIDFDKSSFAHVPTIKHVIDSKTLEFDYIAYEWKKLDDQKLLLSLSTRVQLSTNLQFYAQYWTRILLDDFEKSLLAAFKKTCA
ncbi:MAG: hypothetical protein N4A41_00365 [Crocinitomicaceae bacterium]|nr:hypothetical protein [Crocinitomicaceae bacterium]